MQVVEEGDEGATKYFALELNAQVPINKRVMWDI